MPSNSEGSGRRKARSKKSRPDDVGTSDRATDEAARLALRESDKLYFRIGEVSRITGVKAHVLRYWETEFRWMAPPKSRSKQRLYRKRDIEFVWLLKRLLWEERYTIAGARQRIQELGVDGALALLDPDAEPAKADAAEAPTPSSRSGTTAESSSKPRGPDSQNEWISFRAALADMQSELLALRGVLQDGA